MPATALSPLISVSTLYMLISFSDAAYAIKTEESNFIVMNFNRVTFFPFFRQKYKYTSLAIIKVNYFFEAVPYKLEGTQHGRNFDYV